MISVLPLQTLGLVGAAAVLILTGPAAAAAADKRYGLTSFEEIEVTADVAVEVVTAAPVRAVATGPQAALDRLTLETRDGRLVIGMRQYAGDRDRRTPLGAITIRVNAANLRSATIVGAGSLAVDRLKGTRVVIGLRGPARLTVGEISTDRLSVLMIGNGTMVLGGGKAKDAELTLSGAGSLDAGGVMIDNLKIDSEGAGDHDLHAVKSARIIARGVGRMEVRGRPTCDVRNIGSGSVSCGTTK